MKKKTFCSVLVQNMHLNLISGTFPTPITHYDEKYKFRATCIDTAAELPKDVKDRMPTILCVHGSGGSHEDFIPLLNNLVEDHGFRAVCLNWPGLNKEC